MPVSNDTLQLLIQGGAVSVLLVFGFFAYKLASSIISSVMLIVTNHMDHLTREVSGLREDIREAVDRFLASRDG